MGEWTGAMHVARVASSHVDKTGVRRRYESQYVRRTYRQGGKVRHETVANLSSLPEAAVAAVETVLAGRAVSTADQVVTLGRSAPHGHVAAVAAMARKLGLPALLGRASRARDIALALIIARVVRPDSKLSTAAWWADTTLAADLGVADAGTDEIYHAMDWLASRQDPIEAGLAARHLGPEGNPSGMALFDLSGSWVEGSHCELAARGYSRDGKKGRAQIEYGLLTNPEGVPVAVRVFAGDTGDPTAFTEAVDTVRAKFGLTTLVMVGDRGMITNARIDAVKDATDLGWVTALRAPQIAKLAQGPLQLSLFDQQDLAEITHTDYPGERLIACRNPAQAEQRSRTRESLLAATEAELDKIKTAVDAGRLRDQAKIGIRVGKVINKYKVGKHLTTDISQGHFAYHRDQDAIAAEAALDGIYVIRTSVGTDHLDPAGVVGAYKQLAHVERDLRSIKTDDLELRPIYHRLEARVRAHVLICVLAAYLVWHLRRVWAELTYTDEHPPARANPVAPARRSAAATRKASRKTDPTGQPLRSFQNLLDHLATLTRNQVRFPAASAPETPMLAEPTTTQRRAFDLLDTPIPLTLK